MRSNSNVQWWFGWNQIIEGGNGAFDNQTISGGDRAGRIFFHQQIDLRHQETVFDGPRESRKVECFAEFH